MFITQANRTWVVSLIQADWTLASVHLVRGSFGQATQLLERTLAMAREWDLTIMIQHQQCFLGTAYARSERLTEGLAIGVDDRL